MKPGFCRIHGVNCCVSPHSGTSGTSSAGGGGGESGSPPGRRNSCAQPVGMTS